MPSESVAQKLLVRMFIPVMIAAKPSKYFIAVNIDFVPIAVGLIPLNGGGLFMIICLIYDTGMW